jgi:hypothetical protein
LTPRGCGAAQALHTDARERDRSRASVVGVHVDPDKPVSFQDGDIACDHRPFTRQLCSESCDGHRLERPDLSQDRDLRDPKTVVSQGCVVPASCDPRCGTQVPDKTIDEIRSANFHRCHGTGIYP